MRFIFSLFFILASPPAIAETILVRSGEHVDFSRIVLQAESLETWNFGRVEGGYELRIPDSTTTFNLTRVFDLIPKNRIEDITSPGPGRLYFAVTCECSGDAFEIRDGRLVIDIKDGSPAETSPFEAVLGNLDPSPSEKLETTSTVSQSLNLESWTDFGAPFPTAATAAQMSIPDLSGQPGNSTQDSVQTDPVTSTAAPKMLGETTVPYTSAADASRTLSAVSPVQNGSEDPGQIPDGDQDTEINETTVSTPIQRPALPMWPSTPMLEISALLSPTDPHQNRLLESALLGQLSRAAAQGLLTIPPTEITHQTQASPVQNSDIPTDLMTSQTEQNQRNESDEQPNYRMGTAADRDTLERRQNLLTSAGSVCLEEGVFDVASWGAADRFAPFGNLRTGIVGEFDKPDIDAIIALARRYLYLGFGVEAKILLDGFQVDIPGSDDLLRLANVIDGPNSTPDGQLVDQLSCATNASIWAVLAVQKIPPGSKIDRPSVLLTFSGLPMHLRRHLGPVLAERFIGIEDLETATSINKLMGRGISRSETQLPLTTANLASLSGNVAVQIANLEAAIKTSGPHSAVAMAKLIETKLELDQTIRESTALLAGAMAVENRDSEIGRRLTRATIRAFGMNGQIESTFERIETAQKNGYITRDERSELSLETLFRSAQISSDAEFLTVFFRHGQHLADQTSTTRPARNTTAKRLVALGFSEQAINLYPDNGTILDAQDRIILAGAFLAVGKPDQAKDQVADQSDIHSRLLYARALSDQRNYPAAADIFSELEMAPEHERTAWLAGDWPQITQGPLLARSSAAQLMLDLASTKGMSADRLTEQDSGTNIEPLPPTIADANRILERSSKTRGVLLELLASD